jgi:hypothetical protein
MIDKEYSKEQKRQNLTDGIGCLWILLIIAFFIYIFTCYHVSNY